jgi:hypothetical protein
LCYKKWQVLINGIRRIVKLKFKHFGNKELIFKVILGTI